jgi:class 3 adenylate cyclase
MENAGADRGFLLLKQNNNYLIQASSEDSGESINVLQNKVYRNQNILADTIISYVSQSKKSVVVGNAQTDSLYSKDKYVKESGVQSILSLPIINRGTISGVLYLENNLITEAFKQDRLELLSLLSSQIAVSIENAQLYENLEQKVAERTEELAKEIQKSDKLLLNILPRETAEELKSKGTTTPKKFEKVTVMFTDFKGFTQLSETLTPEELVSEIDTCFSAFDHIIDKYRLEKIKTIGDSYMCVGGLPVPNSTHAVDTVNAALEIIDFMENHNKDSIKLGKPVFDIRIGLHTGPVIAGVVGSKKFIYDIWGDTVNTASRMESSGEIKRLNVSETTYESIKNKFNCTFRGDIEAKNKGLIKMYFVEKN